MLVRTNRVDNSVWKGRRVFITGHTGFKGAWLSLWLQELGAEVSGFALPPIGATSMFALCNVAHGMDSRIGDVRELAALEAALADSRPEIVFHLAAQAFVRRSYRAPVDTYATNVMGTVNILEAAHRVSSVRAMVIVTTDKCYENREWEWPYREGDRLGGFDPYSSSKAAAELVVSSYRRSFARDRVNASSSLLIASARAGNVIGGGDWSEDRLVPDIVRAIESRTTLSLRYPESTRPWQHVLEPLSGYLKLGEALLSGDSTAATAWNFGPAASGEQPVGRVVDLFLAEWPEHPGWKRVDGDHPHEAGRLALDWSRARRRLGWHPRWEINTAVVRTAEWYKAWFSNPEPKSLRRLTFEQIAEHQAEMPAF